MASLWWCEENTLLLSEHGMLCYSESCACDCESSSSSSSSLSSSSTSSSPSSLSSPSSISSPSSSLSSASSPSSISSPSSSPSSLSSVSSPSSVSSVSSVSSPSSSLSSQSSSPSSQSSASSLSSVSSPSSASSLSSVSSLSSASSEEICCPLIPDDYALEIWNGDGDLLGFFNADIATNTATEATWTYSDANVTILITLDKVACTLKFDWDIVTPTESHSETVSLPIGATRCCLVNQEILDSPATGYYRLVVDGINGEC